MFSMVYSLINFPLLCISVPITSTLSALAFHLVHQNSLVLCCTEQTVKAGAGICEARKKQNKTQASVVVQLLDIDWCCCWVMTHQSIVWSVCSCAHFFVFWLLPHSFCQNSSQEPKVQRHFFQSFLAYLKKEKEIKTSGYSQRFSCCHTICFHSFPHNQDGSGWRCLPLDGSDDTPTFNALCIQYIKEEKTRCWLTEPGSKLPVF